MKELLQLNPQQRGRENRQLARELIQRRLESLSQTAAVKRGDTQTKRDDEGRVIEPPIRTVPDSEVYERPRWKFWQRARPTVNTAVRRLMEAE